MHPRLVRVVIVMLLTIHNEGKIGDVREEETRVIRWTIRLQ